MTVRPTDLPGVLVVEPAVYRDDRGRFAETWNAARYAAHGIGPAFVQDNVSVSDRGVVRGLHWQAPPHAQGKLVSVLAGAAFDVVVDLRPGSPTLGQWTGVRLDAESGRQLWVPPGLAHGFQALADGTVFAYKCTAPYAPGHEHSLRWDDPDLAIAWPLADEARLSPKDAAAPLWRHHPALPPPTSGLPTSGLPTSSLPTDQADVSHTPPHSLGSPPPGQEGTGVVDPPKSPTRSESSPERHTNHPALKPVRRDLRAHATPAERALWQALKGSQLGATFRRQHSIGRHVVDFYCPTARLAVELDGGVHDDPARAAADSLRQADLQALGVRVLRFANRDVLQTLDLVAQALRDALADALPHLREDA